MTDIEILEYAIAKIGEITVPLTMMHQVLDPLNEVSKMLTVLLENVKGTVEETVPGEDHQIGGTGEDDEEEFV